MLSKGKIGVKYASVTLGNKWGIDLRLCRNVISRYLSIKLRVLEVF